MEQTNAPAQKKNTGLIIGMVVCIVAALGGIGFGIFGMLMTGSKLAANASDLKIQVKDEDGTVTMLETDKVTVSNDDKVVTIEDSNTRTKNPLFAKKGNNTYFKQFEYTDPITLDIKYIIQYTEGKIRSCDMFRNNRYDGNCNINGITGNIYKIEHIGMGQQDSGIIGFLMEDGTIQYAEYFEFKNGSVQYTSSDIRTINVNKKIKVDGFVTDIIPTSVDEGEGVGGYATTMFILADGSYIEYNPDMMLQK